MVGKIIAKRLGYMKYFSYICNVIVILLITIVALATLNLPDGSGVVGSFSSLIRMNYHI